MSTGGNINDSFFNGIYKEVWRKLIPPGLTEAETDFIMEMGGLQAGDRVLDLMCGYGRHTLALAGKGISVHAIDNQPDYIAEIRQKAGDQNLPVEAVCSSILDTSYPLDCKAAICMGNSFAFFNREEVQVILEKLRRSLQPGGFFMVNTWMLAEIAIRHFKEKDWFYVDGYKYLTDNRFLWDPARIETEHIIVTTDGKSETIKGIDFMFTLSELQELFKNAGFSMLEVFATPRKKKFKLGDTRAYVIFSCQ